MTASTNTPVLTQRDTTILNAEVDLDRRKLAHEVAIFRKWCGAADRSRCLLSQPGESIVRMRDARRAAGDDGIAGAAFVWNFLNERGLQVLHLGLSCVRSSAADHDRALP